LRFGSGSAKTILENKTRWASRFGKGDAATVSEDEARVTAGINFGLASLAVESATSRAARRTTNAVAAVED
jgi:hypothetical protein